MQMMDIIMLALGLAFFALSVGYTIACECYTEKARKHFCCHRIGN
jgi:SNF family Na+-dependent transporter